MDKEQKINQQALESFNRLIITYWSICVMLLVLPSVMSKQGLTIGWIVGSLFMVVMITGTQHRKTHYIKRIRDKLRKQSK